MGQIPQHKTRYTKPDRKKVENSLEYIGTGDKFLNRTPIAQILRSIINKWDLMKSFCKKENPINRTKWQPTEQKKIFTKPTTDRGLISKIHIELQKLDTNKPNNPIKKWGTELNRKFSTEDL